MNVGDSKTLVATIAPTNATEKTLVWTSSNSNVVTVENGKITAKKVGSAVITVSNSDGTKKATCNVQVSEKANSTDDNTTAKGTLPKTGYSSLIILSILLVLCVLVFILYKKYIKFKKI